MFIDSTIDNLGVGTVLTRLLQIHSLAHHINASNTIFNLLNIWSVKLTVQLPPRAGSLIRQSQECGIRTHGGQRLCALAGFQDQQLQPNSLNSCLVEMAGFEPASSLASNASGVTTPQHLDICHYTKELNKCYKKTPIFRMGSFFNY